MSNMFHEFEFGSAIRVDIDVCATHNSFLAEYVSMSGLVGCLFSPLS